MPDSALGTGKIAKSKIMSAVTEFSFWRLGLGLGGENMVVK